MSRKTLLLISLIVLCRSMYSHAQTNPEIIPAERTIDWSQAGVPGGIPNRADGTCATLNPGATATDIDDALTLGPIGALDRAHAVECVLAAVHWARDRASTLRISLTGPHLAMAPLLSGIVGFGSPVRKRFEAAGPLVMIRLRL